MAYGKLKVDTLTWDNSGTDTDVTIASLGNKASLPASAGTVGASEVVQVDANKDTTGIRNLTISGNLQVNGTTTTVASSTMTVTDKNIEIAKGAANDAAADGAGITVASDDGAKTWNWVDATDAWTSSEHIHLGDSKKVLLGTDSDLEVYHSGTHGWVTNTTGSLFIKSDNAIKFQDAGGNEDFLSITDNGAVEIFHTNSKKFETTANGVTVTGAVSDSKGDVRSIIVRGMSSSHTLVASDAGKAIYISTGGVTIPNSVMAAGDAVTIVNNSGSDQTITQGSGVSIYNSADASTGNRILAARGMATIWFAAADTAYISGAGLS